MRKWSRRVSEAQAAANNLDTHRQAQADERGHQANMTHLSAQMMNAAKQNPNTPAVPQQIPPQQIPGQPIIMNVTGAGAQSPTPAAPQSATSSCGSCGTPTQQGWKACPELWPIARPNRKEILHWMWRRNAVELEGLSQLRKHRLIKLGCELNKHFLIWTVKNGNYVCLYTLQQLIRRWR